MKEKRAPERKKRASKRTAGQAALVFLFSLIVIAMSLLVAYAMKLGIGAPEVALGEVVETPPALEAATKQPVTETSEEPQPTEPEDPALDAARQRLSEMTLEEKVYQLFITTPDDLTGQFGLEYADEEDGDTLQEMPVGGLIVYEANIYNPEQVLELLSGLQGYAKTPMFIGVLGEGGYDEGLSRFGIAQEYESMSSYGEAGDAAAVHAMGAELGKDLRAVGFNLNFAPVADVLVNEDNQEVGDRSFGSDATTVAAMVTEMISGLHEGGVLSCMKHFPGLASASGNTTYGAAANERSAEELQGTELLPFRAGITAGADMIMVSHLSLPNVLEDSTPASLSPAIVTNLLREELGFEGVIVTDTLNKGAITLNYDSAEAAVQALLAGCDMLLEPENLQEAAAGVLEALEDGTLTEERIDASVLRILLLKYKSGIAD